jgi:anaerobic magnesium-protoporphyrin IX monomethyl ester cyclase
MRKTFLSYPWIRDSFKRKYMLGCLKAFAKTTITKRFYDIGRVHQKGFNTEIDLDFDETKVYSREQLAEMKASGDDMHQADIDYEGGQTKRRAPAGQESNVTFGAEMHEISPCGAPNGLPIYDPEEAESTPEGAD